MGRLSHIVSSALAWLGLTVGSGLAAFVYSGPQSVDPFGGPPAMIDLNEDLQNDLSFLFGVFESATIASGQFIVDIETGNSVLFQGGVPALLTPGSLIQETPIAPREWRGDAAPSGSLINGWNYRFETSAWTGWTPPVPAGNRGFMGVQFQTTTGMRLGWVEITFQGTGVDSAPLIVGWGYETDPVSSLVVGVVPEPGSIVLLALGLAAVAARSTVRGFPVP